MFWTIISLSCVLLLTTIAPHFPGKHWTIRVWEFPRLQQAFTLALLIIGWTWWLTEKPIVSTVFIIMLTIALLYQLRWIIPYTPFWPEEVRRAETAIPEREITILTSNVLMTNKNFQGLIDLVYQHKPDMLVTLETNKEWEDALTPIHKDYPHRLACPLENLYGMHLYSKLPFLEAKQRFIVEDDVPSMQIDVMLDSERVTIYFLHPKPPSPTENASAGPRDAELAIVGKEVSEHTNPVIVSGDLNDVAWSPTTRKFRSLSKALDPRRGRGFFNTFHAEYKLVRWPLDHIFHSHHFSLRSVQRLPGYGSDHFPLLSHLQLTPGKDGTAPSGRQEGK